MKIKINGDATITPLVAEKPSDGKSRSQRHTTKHNEALTQMRATGYWGKINFPQFPTQ
jgi:hypothetical protein